MAMEIDGETGNRWLMEIDGIYHDNRWLMEIDCGETNF